MKRSLDMIAPRMPGVPLTQGTAGFAHAPQLTDNIRIRGRMTEDSKDDSVATDDDSDYTFADGNHSLNNVVNMTPIFPIYFKV